MIEVLRQIIQEVNAAQDLKGAMTVMVDQIKSAMSTEVASVYLLDHSKNRYVLMASNGLKSAAVGKASLAISEGLVGQVGLREEPINLEAASTHPKYAYLAETGEEEFQAFLGVPIIHQRKLLGVLVVQQRAQRRFDQSEEAFLVTTSAQLAGGIAHAEASGAIVGNNFSVNQNITKFKGVAGSTGVAIGEALVVSQTADLNALPHQDADDIDGEIEKFQIAIQAVRNDVKALAKKVADKLQPEEAELFDVYLKMLDDSALGGEIVLKIKEGLWAQGAVGEVIKTHIRTFERMEDAYLRERAADVKDLGLRVLAKLQESTAVNLEYPEHTVLMGDEITTSMLLEVPTENIRAVVSVNGSGNSHMAIVARSLGIPTVLGAVDLPLSQMHSQEVVVDAYQGEVIFRPSANIRARYKSIIAEEKEITDGLEEIADEDAITPDGVRITLLVNTGLMADVTLSLRRGAEGVGLYRTEIPFMVRDRFPSEVEQGEIYRGQLEAFAPAPVTMRTLDIGGDKALSYFPINEDNPFLGWRGIRITLDHPEIFMVQLKAMLKASEGLDNLRLMLPMISSVKELEEALHLIHRGYFEVLEEGFHVVMPPVGIMIEVPAAVYQIRDYAQLVDFISVGSNDLTQYLLAVDRNNPRVADLYQSTHPAVLKALQFIVQEAKLEHTPVSICGEMAGNPATAVLLMAMGYESLSMSASSLLKVKWLIRNLAMSKAKTLLEEVLNMDSAAVIRSHIDFVLAKEGLGDIVQPSRRNQ